MKRLLSKLNAFETIIKNLLPVIGLSLFITALWVLHKELKDYHIHDILFQLTQIPFKYIIFAFLFMICDYFVLTLYDFLALKSIGHPLNYGSACLASFISFAFSHNIGFSLVSGGSIRYRIYTSLGLSPIEIARIIGFTSGTFWLGYSIIGGAAFYLILLFYRGNSTFLSVLFIFWECLFSFQVFFISDFPFCIVLPLIFA